MRVYLSLLFRIVFSVIIYFLCVLKRDIVKLLLWYLEVILVLKIRLGSKFRIEVLPKNTLNIFKIIIWIINKTRIVYSISKMLLSYISHMLSKHPYNNYSNQQGNEWLRWQSQGYISDLHKTKTTFNATYSCITSLVILYDFSSVSSLMISQYLPFRQGV